ncbi:MAG: PAS domain-containing protein [Bacteroidetes bacterium]|nr:PAS domain-containing protein [Bacteroidota bacterium]
MNTELAERDELILQFGSASIFLEEEEEEEEARTVVSLLDITERKQAEINLKRREAILETISISAEKFLTAKNINEPVNDTLRLLCEATDASRVYIFKFHNSGDGKLLTSQTHESVKEGITSQIDNPELQNLDIISAGYNRWVKTFEKHEPIVGLIKDFPDSEKEILRAQDVQSISVVPIYVSEKLYGFIGFDECLYERSWSKPEIEDLQAVANLIAGAIVREENRKELVENEERLRSIINSTPLGSHVYEIIDGDLILIDANSSANMILGVDHRKLKNKNIKDIFPLIGFSSIADEFKNVATTGKSFTKDFIISGEGIFTGIFEFFAFQIKKNSMALFFRDITEQKKLELRIQKSEERFKLASQSTHDSIWDRDLLTNKIWWSANMNKIFDLDIGNTETDIKKWYELIHPEDLHRVEVGIKEAINGGKEYWSDEYRLLMGDGNYAYALDRGYIIRDKYRKPIRMVGSILDYTEKVRHEQDLIAAKEKAEEANRLKSGFISAMSHEIRTPLNIILGYNDLINEMYCDPANEEIQAYFNSITNNGNRLIDTITKILDISRIEAGEFPITLQPIPIKEIIDRTYYSMKILAEKKKLRLVFNPPAENISVLADPYCLENSLINLLNNAIKYSEKGKIEISLKKENKFAVCKIKDEGIGMSEDYQKHLFQTFSQEKVGINRPYEGVGLGLALTKKYCERMQAGIEIQSKQGSGTTVTLKLPLAK